MKARRVWLLAVSSLLLSLGFFLKIKNTPINFDTGGTVAGSQTAISPSLPGELPTLPQSILTSILQKETSLEATLESTLDPLAIEKFYREKLADLGYEAQGNYFLKEGRRINWQIVQNKSQTQSIVLLNYVFVPTK